MLTEKLTDESTYSLDDATYGSSDPASQFELLEDFKQATREAIRKIMIE